MTALKSASSGPFPALAEPAIRRYLCGQTASVMGSWTQNITLNLLLWEQTHAAWQLGLLNFLLYGPALFVAPIFGSRLNPTAARVTALRILFCALFLAACLLAANLAGWLREELVIGASLVCGVLSAMEMPSRQLLLTTTLQDKSSLPSVIALNTLVFNVGRMVGPVIASYAFLRLGATGGFALNIVGLATMLLCIGSLPTAEQALAPKKSAGFRMAVAYARGNKIARQCLPTLAVLGLLGGSYQTLIPVLAAHRFGNAAKFTGVFFSCAGAGAMMAAILLSSRLLSPRSSMRIHAAAPWLTVMALAGVSLASSPWLAGACFAGLGLALTFFATTTNSTLQRDCPNELRGGIVGLYGMAYLGTMPLGHLLMGNIANFVGEQIAFGLMACGLAVCLTTLHIWIAGVSPTNAS
ncbi:MFS transporter [Cupriavidus sp. IK-TO18]|uniref:MFS transporter n=1 Tax=Cupriavidus sp. IK-TO18 TaxID=2782182 RepID=UPI001898A12E|nr:MFS transporter [Cupriavidus sp. IK-TO18]MBF6989143.1 MFS transporter [Cupriavidus sp. IK-TO18]